MTNETTTYPVTIPSTTRAAFLGIAPLGTARVATDAPAAVVQGSGLSATGHGAVSTRQANALIPTSDVVVMKDGASGFRTWSPPV